MQIKPIVTEYKRIGKFQTLKPGEMFVFSTITNTPHIIASERHLDEDGRIHVAVLKWHPSIDRWLVEFIDDSQFNWTVHY